MSPTNEDAALTLLAALRQDLQNFRDEWKRELQELVTKAVFDSEMRRRDDQVASLNAALVREAEARGTFADALKAERVERRTTIRWIVGLMGAPVAGLVTNAVVQLWANR